MEERNEKRERMRQLRRRRARLQWTALLLTVVLVVLVAVALLSDQKGTVDPDGTVHSGKLSACLLGEQTVTLEYGAEFTDPGVLVTYDGETVDAQVTVSGPDLTALGTGAVRYTVTWGKKTLTLERTVTVVDTQAPQITLNTVPGYFTEVGQEYQEEGFTALDNYDGNITDRVIVTRETDAWSYTVTDSSGNTTVVKRVIVYGDTTAPEITLLGGDSVTVQAGSDYEELGYTATDNVDGDLTAFVEVTGEYDKYLPGTYSMTYTVTDAHGNTATVVREVVVEGLVQPDTVQPDGKVIYLTFDDGPSQYTLELLEVLEKYNAKATFFVVGSSRLEYLDEIAAGGHSIGIHSDTHDYAAIYASEDAFFDDFYALRQKIYDRTGIWTTLCRFPGGSSNTISKRYCTGIMTKLTQDLTAQGYQYFDWNVDSNDAGGTKTTEGVYENVINGIGSKKVAIVLQHDIYKYSVDAVEKIIQWGLANGYTFQALDATSPAAHHSVNN